MGTWAEQYVDQQVDQAWLALRMDLAERFEAGLATGEMNPIDITTPTGETVSVQVLDDQVVVMAGDEFRVTDNVDEAAFEVYSFLHDQWQVVHPVFLDSLVVEAPSVEDNPVGEVVPALGRAESKEQLQAWVVSTFNEDRTMPVRVSANGDINWRTRKGARVTVRVQNAGRIELFSVLAREVSFKKARKVIDEQSRRFFGLKFFLQRDTLVMSQIVIAYPFSGEQLNHALSTFMRNADDLGWVADKVLRKRVKQRRALEVPPKLMAFLPMATATPRAELSALLETASGSRATLGAWRAVAQREWLRARRLAALEPEFESIHKRAGLTWWRLRRAMDVVLEPVDQQKDVA